MHLCRAAWQRLAPLASRRGSTSLLQTAPLRQMSSGSVPGSSGDALPYYLFVGVSVAGGGFYLYRTLSRDRSRFEDRHEYLANRRKGNTNIFPPHVYSNPLQGEEAETSIVSEEAAQAVTVEAVAVAAEEAVEEVIEQETVPTASLDPEETVSDEVTPVATEVAEEQEPTPSAEVAPVQEEQDVGSTEQISEETSPILETSSDDIQEELSSAAEDWSELSARKPEEAGEEALQDTEGQVEAVESEEVSASS
ncbi:protein MGARP [Discoglossus pictus]